MKLNDRKIKTQEAILLRVHKGCSLEEAKGKDCGCYNKLGKHCSSIGHLLSQPTLSRVLVALGDEEFMYFEGHIWLMYSRESSKKIARMELEKVCERKLLNQDGSDCVLWSQSSETQQKISELLGVE